MNKKIFALILLVNLVLPSIVSAETIITNEEKISALKEEIADLSALLNPSLIKNLSFEEKRTIIASAILWLKADQESSGHMGYEYFPYKNTWSTSDNMVRQAGSLYEMGEVLSRDKNDNFKLKANIEKSLTYFKSLTKSGNYNGKNFECVTNGAESNICKLGATSLVLTGLISYVQAYPAESTKYSTLIENYKNYILAMKKPSSGLREVFHLDTGVADTADSPYSNGEALLALVRYGEYKNFPSDIKNTIDEIIKYIETLAPDTSLYLWAMTAIKDLNNISPRADYFGYVKGYTDWRMSGFTNKRNDPHNYCAYIEGLASAYPVIKTNVSSKESLRYKNEIEFWLAKSALLQLNENDVVKFDPSNPALFSKITTKTSALGGFLTGQMELSERVDFTQHCLSSYLQTYSDIDGKTL